jgi:DNA-binding NarL/FixJ family response regulator
VKILVAYADGLVLAGVRQALAAGDGLEVVAEAHDTDAVMRLVDEADPEVVLLDLELPGVGGLLCLSAVRAARPDIQVVMSAATSDRELIEAAFAAGACGYVMERINPADLAAAIRQGVESARALGRSQIGADPVGSDGTGLTPREAEVLRAVANGLTNQAVADELRVSVQTVKFHLTSVYRKLQVANRTEATRWALDRHHVG